MDSKKLLKEWATHLKGEEATDEDTNNLENAMKELAGYGEKELDGYEKLKFLSATQKCIAVFTFNDYSALISIDKHDNDFNVMVKKGELGKVGTWCTDKEILEKLLKSEEEGKFTVSVPSLAEALDAAVGLIKEIDPEWKPTIF